MNTSINFPGAHLLFPSQAKDISKQLTRLAFVCPREVGTLQVTVDPLRHSGALACSLVILFKDGTGYEALSSELPLTFEDQIVGMIAAAGMVDRAEKVIVPAVILELAPEVVEVFDAFPAE